MRRIPKFWGLHARPSAVLTIALGLAPFIALIAVYLTVSHVRLTANPSDKLTPSVTQMVEAVKMMAFTKDKRTGEYLMLSDTLSSLRRMAIGLGMAALVGLFLGMHMGMLPGPGVLWLPFITFLSIIPPLAILPILFIIFGVGELGKVMLIFLGSLFMITRDICDATQRIPREQIVKALTLGASQVAVFTRIVVPQVMPRLFITVRLCLGAAWLFLIAAEAIASTDGLGYRIFLVRRYLSMNVIIPYVLWITALGFLMDGLLRIIVKWKYPWYAVSEQQVSTMNGRPGNDKILYINDVYKVYGSKVVLDNIDLKVSAGELCTVVGPSGCGKSTLLRLILGQEQPSRGDIQINHSEAGFPSPDRGIVYQKYSLFPHLSVLDNVMLGKQLSAGIVERFTSRATFHDEALFYLEKMRLTEHVLKYPHELSGGMQQRVALAQSLIMKPKILLMDEPFGALDPGTREHLQIFLLELWEEFDMTLFFVTHDLEEAVFLGTRIIVLSQYYVDGRGEICGDRGARVVADYPLPRRATSTVVKQAPEFGKLIDDIRRDGFDPGYRLHVSQFNLRHEDSVQSLTEEERRPVAL